MRRGIKKRWLMAERLVDRVEVRKKAAGGVKEWSKYGAGR